MAELGIIRRSVVLKIEQGLHIRACSKVLAIIDGFPGTVSISIGERKANASSMFDLLSLAAMPGSLLDLEATGEGADTVLDRLEELFSKTDLNFDQTK